MKQIYTHRIEKELPPDAPLDTPPEYEDLDLNTLVRIEHWQQTPPGQACNKYLLMVNQLGQWQTVLHLNFQNGSHVVKGSPKDGVPDRYMPNGITNEALLAILIDRLEAYQAGNCKCQDNEIALGHLKAALNALQHRTNDRITRNVIATNGV